MDLTTRIKRSKQMIRMVRPTELTALCGYSVRGICAKKMDKMGTATER